MKAHLIGALLVVMGMATTGMAQSDRQLPDSMLTRSKVHEVMYADRQLAERIVSQMRQQKAASAYDIDLTTADIHYNYMEFQEAAAIYERLLASREVKADDEKTMSVLESLCDAYDALHDLPHLQQCITELFDRARAAGSPYYQSIALYLQGKSLYYQGERQDGISHVERAIALMEQADSPNRQHLLHSQLNVLATMLTDAGRYDQALRAHERNEQVLRSTDSVDVNNLMVLLAKKASLLVKMGRLEQSDSVYAVWQALPKNENPRTYFIIDYLRNRGRYDEALPIYEARLATMRQSGDSMNLRTYIMKWGMAETCYGLGQYQRAADLYLDVVNIGDSLQRLDAQANAKELETIYRTHEKEQQIARQRLWLLLLTAVVLLLVIGAAFWARHSLIVRRKNRAMAQTINELLTYRQLALKEKAEASSLKAEASASKESDDAGERAAFLSIDRLVVSQQLFCHPGFDREQLARATGIEKNRLSAIINRYAATNIPGYINAKRTEHATQLMRQYPDYTLAAIAEQCGFTSQTTFIRAFKNSFGMTPSEFHHSRNLPPPPIDRWD